MFLGISSRPQFVRLVLVCGCLFWGVAFCQSSAAQTSSSAVILDVQGAIGPAVADYLSRGLETAAKRNASLVILHMDTPGGLDTSMRDIIRDILASPVPVATFVGPSGARAASAGTYILYASHVAAMAPGTNLGAATPVTIGGGMPFGGGGRERDSSEKKEGQSEKAEPAAPENASEAKAINDAVAYIRSLAQLRDRNADWAESAVRQAASLPSEEALKRDVIDFVVRDIDELLTRLDGHTYTAAGVERTLSTKGIASERIAPDWRTRTLSIITDPTLVMVLMMIGIYGLFFEFMNPGALYPGVIGAICLLVALYGLAALPLNFAGFGLVFLGLALIVAEAFSPSFGILGIGGTIAFVLGASLFFSTTHPDFQISWSVIGGLAVTSLGFIVLTGRLALATRGLKVVSGQEEMIGLVGRVDDWNSGGGHVFVRGERWNARGETSFIPLQKVRILRVDGLTLTVEPAENQGGAQPRR